MIERKPQKQLLQFVMLLLLSVVSVVMTANESFAALQCYNCHGNNTNDALPLDTAPGSPASYRNITTGAVKGNHQTHLSGLNITSANQSMCARCHNNSGYTSSHRSGTITLNKAINASPLATGYTGAMSDGGTFLFKNQTSLPTLGSCSSVNCHFESATPAWGSDPATVNCDSCHTAQPTTGSHAKHEAQYGGTASCVKCHADRTANFQHATSAGNAGRNIDLSALPAGTYTGGNFQYLPSQSGTRSFGQCDNIYCHSSGQGAGGSASFAPAGSPPVWGNAGSATCGSCHEINLLNTGGHSKHIAKSSNCGNCHTGATAGTYVSTNHVNSLVDVNGTFAVGYSQTASSALGNGYGTCSAASCHSPTTAAAPVTPTWGAVANCETCHNGSLATIVSGAHVTHNAMSGVLCNTCHSSAVSGSNGGAGHFDGVVNVTQYTGGNVAKHAAGVYSATCTTACHSATTTAVVTPTWGGATTCASCHDNTAATLVTGAHTKHNNMSGITCGTCHTGSAAGTTSGGPGHGNSVIDVVGLTSGSSTAKHAAGAYVATCTVACHSTTTAAILTPTWGGTAACNSCHANTTATLVTGAHTKHNNMAGVTCGSCHTGSAAGTTSGGAGHGNSVIDVIGLTTGTNTAKHAAGAYVATCTVACHSTTTAAILTPTWGGTAACNSCHANTTATLVTGAHTKHNNMAGVTCGSCHTGSAAGTTSGGAGHGNSVIDVVGLTTGTNTAKHAAGAYVATCTVTCHSTTTAAILTPTWGATATCSSCHANTAATLVTGAHSKHNAMAGVTCGSCHTGSAAGTTSGGPGHGNSVIDVAGLTTGTNTAKHAAGAYVATCTVTCHSTTTAAILTPTWGAVAACNSCHANTTATLVTGAHTKHNALAGVTCGSCHTGSAAGTTSGGAGHGNSVIDVVGLTAGTNTAKHAAGAYVATCTVTCHSATNVAVATPTWGATANCATCHAASPATGAHSKHMLGTNFKAISCGDCHAGAVAGSNGGTAHLDGNVDVSATGYGTNITKHAVGTYSGSCATTYCHGNTLAAGASAKVVPTWGASITNCAGCHGNPPFNPSHFITATSTYVATNSCSGCHSHVEANGTTFNDPAKHVDGIIQGGKCDSCHGYPPVPVRPLATGTGIGHINNYTSARYQSYSGGGGVHAVAGHLALNIKVGDQFTPCATCHPTNSHNEGFGSFSTHHVQVVVAAKYKFDKNRPIVYNAKQSGTGKTTGTCTNVECHFQKSPVWSSQGYTTGH